MASASSPVDPDAGTWLLREINEQPAVYQRVLDHAGDIAAVRDAITAYDPKMVLFNARGSSRNAASYGVGLCVQRLGRPSGLVAPSSVTIYHARPHMDQAVFISVSQSGASEDLIQGQAVARSCQALTVAITNDANSPLATQAHLSLPLHAGPERAVAASKTYTAALLTLFLLLGDASRDERRAVEALPDAAADAVTRPIDDIDHIAARLRFAERAVVIGRGFSYVTAREATLKLMETCYLSAHAFSSAELMHGPIAMVDQNTPVIAVSGGARAESSEAIVRLRAIGADVVTLDQLAPVHPAVLQLDAVLPMVDILDLQLLCHRLALSRGIDPDRPRNLAKVTLTL